MKSLLLIPLLLSGIALAVDENFSLTFPTGSLIVNNVTSETVAQQVAQNMVGAFLVLMVAIALFVFIMKARNSDGEP